jgi:tRNA(Ile2) C34 agmatinyltransferase TiaS
MANWLCQNGHSILKVEDSEKDSRFKVFLFEDTAELHNTMKRFHKGA